VTVEEFRSLRRGHVVIWRDRDLRVVQRGPADEPNSHWMGHGCVEFLKLVPIGHRGRLYQPWTIYGYNDVKDKISGPYTRLHPRKVFELEKRRVSNWYRLREHAKNLIAEAKRLNRPLVPTMRCLLTLGKRP
jgi:hypothetical protein